ncbi:alpha/beta fold hydrolase [Enterococcus sp. LJL99]
MKTNKKTYITKDASKIFYEVTGSGFPLLLLHGNGGSSKYFSKQIPELSRYFKVYAIDSRGHGQSTNTSATLTFQQMSEDLFALMEIEQIKEADILGFSDGANLAMVFTVNHPDKVHSLVLNAGNTLDSGVVFPLRIATYIEYMLVSFLSLFSQKMKQKKAMVALMMRDIGINSNELKKIKCRTLILVGKYDIIKRSHSLYLARTIPKASFVLIPGQGHLFARKAPALFNQNILKFLLEKKV